MELQFPGYSKSQNANIQKAETHKLKRTHRKGQIIVALD